MNPVVREPPALKHVRWTVDEYFRLVKLGLLGDRRVELLNGRIIEMPAQAHPHRLALSKLARLFFSRFPPESHWVVVEGTFVLSKHHAPDPDLHVFDVPEGTPEADLPLPIIVIEISDTTYRKDSGAKLRAYAAGGVRDYWILNIPLHRIEVYRSPENPTGKKSDWQYADRAFFSYGQQVQLLARPDVSFPVEALLP
jgi:Uma2 family endonuclease